MSKDWARKYPEKHAAKSARYRSANPERAKMMVSRWVAENPSRDRESKRLSQARTRLKLKAEMVAAYGGKCSCCGEDDPRFLTLEHIGGRTGVESKNSTLELARLKRLGWPDSCTCYCFNCNMGSWRNGGICPHLESEVDDEDGS